MQLLTLILVFIAGACFGILVIGLCAVNDEMERKEKKK